MDQFLVDLQQDERISDMLVRARTVPPATRKQVVRDLVRAPAPAVLDALLPMLHEEPIENDELLRLLRVLARVLAAQPALGATSPIASKAGVVLGAIKHCCMAVKDQSLLDGEELVVLTSFVRVVGLKTYISALRPFSEDRNNALCIAAAAQAIGLPLLLPLVRTLVQSDDTVELGVTVVQKLPSLLKPAVLLPFVPELVQYCVSSLDRHAGLANSALTALADKLAPHGMAAFEPALDVLWKGARRRNSHTLSFLRTLGAITPLAGINAPEIAASVLDLAINTEISSDEGCRRVLGVLRRCAAYAPRGEKTDELLTAIVNKFWTLGLPEPLSVLAVSAIAELPLNPALVVSRLVEHNMFGATPNLQRMALRLLGRLHFTTKLVLDSRTEQLLAEGIITCLPLDVEGDNVQSWSVVSAHAMRNVVAALPSESVGKHTHMWIAALLARAVEPAAVVRCNAFKVLTALAPALAGAGQQLVFSKLYEELGEEYPEVLAEVVTCIHALLACFSAEQFCSIDPEIPQLLPRLTPILRNRNEAVQESCIKLVHAIAQCPAADTVAAREWMQVCFEMLELQRAPRQTTRYEATAAFAAISAVVGPADVVATLIDRLKSPDRQFRVTTAAAIASVAKETGAFAILPILLNEYAVQDIAIQHGVLKALAFMFQFLPRNEIVPLVTSMTNILDNALLDSNQVHRQTAATIVHYIAQACIGEAKEALMVHFLNELMPSIFESSSHVIDRVNEAVSSLAQAVGPAMFANYCWSGLFHPAKKVRNVYWQIWNTLNERGGDALVPVFPMKCDDLLEPEADIRDVWF